MEPDDKWFWAFELLKASDSTDSTKLLEEVMADPRCDAFGPVHHFIVGGVLLACLRNVRGEHDLIGADLDTLAKRSACVPGAACANWGVCGAAISAGMAYSIYRENGPLKAEGWSEDQKMVAAILNKIADSGSPRCCKRDSRITVSMATDYLNDVAGCSIGKTDTHPVCETYEKNTVCLGADCPYHPAHAAA